MQSIVLGIDPGSANSGVVILRNDKIQSAQNLNPADLWDLVDRMTLFPVTGESLDVVCEDIRPYTSRFTMTTINTIKMIGRLEYVLQERRVPLKLITRNEVKSFVFNQYPQVAIPEIIKKIARKKEKVTKSGNPFKPSFQYVDDRIVKLAMKAHWKIEKPKPGKKAAYGLGDHSWQALGVLSQYLHQLNQANLGWAGAAHYTC